MVIVSDYKGDQRKFHFYWLPLMYKHNECTFYIKDHTGKLIYPKDLKNLKVIEPHQEPKINKGSVLKCPIDRVPTYKAMVDLQNKKDGSFTMESLGSKFYEV